MGQTQSGRSPITLITDHFKEVRARAHSLSVEIKKSWMVIFCSAELPSFNIGWPPEGTLDLRTVWRVREIILRPRSGHPDQVPYILVWEDLIVSPTPWIQPVLPPQAAAATEILLAEEKKKPPAAPSAPVLEEDSTLDLLITPPPYSLPPPIQPEPPTSPTFPRSGWGRTCNEYPKL